MQKREEGIPLEWRWELAERRFARPLESAGQSHTHAPQVWEKREGMNTNTRGGPAQHGYHGYHGSRSLPDCAPSSRLPVYVKIAIPALQEGTPRRRAGKGAAQTHGLANGRLATWKKMLWVQIYAFQVGTPPQPRAGTVRFPWREAALGRKIRS